MSNFMRSVELKLERASAQVKSLDASFSDWANRNPITAECKLREGRLGFQLILKDFTEPAPLDEWGLILGEFSHNLRSALDNLAYALARLRRDPPEKPKQIAFPIYQDKAEFDKYGKRNIDQLPAAAAELIERIQPFQRDGSPALGTPDQDALVLLQSLNNADKHRVPRVALIVPKSIKHEVGVEFQCDEDAASNVPPDTTVWGGPLVPRAVLLEWKTNKPIASVRGELHCTAVATIEGLHKAEPIAQTMQALHQYIALVAAQFRPFFC